MSSRRLPPRWTGDEFDRDREIAIEIFRTERVGEDLAEYLETFDEARGVVEELLEQTVDLSRIDRHAIEVLTQPSFLEAVRYIAGPPISEDDLKTLTEASLAPGKLNGDRRMAERIIDTVMLGLDRRRFPWVSEDREPTDAERSAAALASASLIASRRVMTNRANSGKDAQEDLVAATLEAAGYTKVPPRAIRTTSQAPKPGQFCRETPFGTRKADLVVTLWDSRIMPIECKVSNSSTNSVKRLNNDAAVKAKTWIQEFGTISTVPAAVVSGVYKCHNLMNAQADGLTIFWAHNLHEAFSDFITRAR